MKRVVGHFGLDPADNEDKRRNTGYQPEQVDERIAFLSEQVSKGQFDVVFEHELLVNFDFVYSSMFLSDYFYSYLNASTGFRVAAFPLSELLFRIVRIIRFSGLVLSVKILFILSSGKS